MRIDAATTGISVREHCCAFEAEAGLAVAAEHFVALLVLCLLAVDVLLCHSHAARRALFRTRLLHPLFETLLALDLLRPAAPLGVLLAREALVERTCPTAQTRFTFAVRTPKAPFLIIPKGYPHGAVRCRAWPEVGYTRDRLLQTPDQQTLNKLNWQELSQLPLSEVGAALGAGDAGCTQGKPRFRMPLYAARAVVTVLAAEHHGTPRLDLAAAD
mmetsp:Transcript_47683/g.134615  ORF Transcript_47683/g.134615 Transcript_47683/m.134615 type:complete len:215 (-) Transcript_47683:745-1389(-)